MEGRATEIEAYLRLRVQGVERVSIGDWDRARGAVQLVGGNSNRKVRELLAAYPVERLTALPSLHRSLVPFMAGVPGAPAMTGGPALEFREQERLLGKELLLAGITDYTIRTPPGEDLSPPFDRWSVELGSEVSRLAAAGAIARTPRVRDVRAHSSRREIEFVVDLAGDRSPLSCGQWEGSHGPA